MVMTTTESRELFSPASSPSPRTWRTARQSSCAQGRDTVADCREGSARSSFVMPLTTQRSGARSWRSPRTRRREGMQRSPRSRTTEPS